MDFSSIPLFNLMKTKLDYLSERQAALAQNVANADTPGYKAVDVTAPDFKAMVKTAGGGTSPKLKMAVTSSMHIMPAAGAGKFRMEPRQTTDALKPDGNNVSVQEEMANVAANQADYQKVLSLYGKTITMFKTAIGNPNTAS